MNFTEYANDYVSRQEYRLAPSTVENYRAYIKTLDSLIGNVPVSTIMSKHIDIVGRAVGNTERGKLQLRFVFSVLSDAIANGETEARNLKAPKLKIQQAKPLVTLSAQESESIIKHAPAHHQPLFWFLLLTGARPCEALGLKWEDVSDTHAIICQGRVRGKDGDTKTGKSRKVPLSRKLKNVISKMERTEGNVFTNLAGEPMSSNIDKIWRDAAAKAGIKSHVYDLRHTFATTAINGGVSLALVSQVYLGHASINTTITFYCDVNSRQEGEQEKLEQLLG